MPNHNGNELDDPRYLVVERGSEAWDELKAALDDGTVRTVALAAYGDGETTGPLPATKIKVNGGVWSYYLNGSMASTVVA